MAHCFESNRVEENVRQFFFKSFPKMFTNEAIMRDFGMSPLFISQQLQMAGTSATPVIMNSTGSKFPNLSSIGMQPTVIQVYINNLQINFIFLVNHWIGMDCVNMYLLSMMIYALCWVISYLTMLMLIVLVLLIICSSNNNNSRQQAASRKWQHHRPYCCHQYHHQHPRLPPFCRLFRSTLV